MTETTRPKYSMALVRKKTGLTDRQIRYYEEVGLINPVRTTGNQRIFTAGEIERLLKIKELLAGGMNIEGIKEHLSSRADLPLNYTPTPPARSLPGMKRGLTSLYPVSNRAQLVEMIVQRRREKEKNKT